MLISCYLADLPQLCLEILTQFSLSIWRKTFKDFRLIDIISEIKI